MKFKNTRPTGKIYYIGGVAIEEIEVEPCYRGSQYGKGLPITCRCTRCTERNQTPEEALISMNKAHGIY